MHARRCIRLAYLGAAGLLLAAGPAAALPVGIDASIAHTLAQPDAPAEGGRIIKVQKRGDGGFRSDGGFRPPTSGGDGGSSPRIGGGGDGGGGGSRRGGRGDDGKRDYSFDRGGDRDDYRRRGRDRDGRRHRSYRPRYYDSLPFIFSYPYPYAYRYAYPSDRCAYWHRRCVANWGYRNSNYYGCMRYYGC